MRRLLSAYMRWRNTPPGSCVNALLRCGFRWQRVDSWHAGELNLSVRCSVWLLSHRPSSGHRRRSERRCACKQQGEVSLSGGGCRSCACCSACRCNTLQPAQSSTWARLSILQLQPKKRSGFAIFRCGQAQPSSHHGICPSLTNDFHRHRLQPSTRFHHLLGCRWTGLMYGCS